MQIQDYETKARVWKARCDVANRKIERLEAEKAELVGALRRLCSKNGATQDNWENADSLLSRMESRQ